MLWVALTLNVATGLESGHLPRTCGACVALDHVWCYHDDVCYAHGDKNDTKSFSCPGEGRCASFRNCNCHSCNEDACKPKVPNARSCGAVGSHCPTNGTYCPPQSPGAAKPNGSCCTGGKWAAGICPPPPLPPPAYPPVTGPAQVHLGLGLKQGTMTVSWVTDGNPNRTLGVRFGRAGAPLTSLGELWDSRPLNIAGNRTTHVATLSGLVQGATYTYQVEGHPLRFNFTYRTKHRADGAPDKHIIFGDLGASYAFSLCEACSKSSIMCNETTCKDAKVPGGIASEIDADMILHVGDFAYNFDHDRGAVGDAFMANIEQIAARVPYMVSIGNHEDTSSNMAHFVERFRAMPSNAVPATYTTAAGTTTNSMYYSWDSGLVHYIALSTEFYFGKTDGNSTRETQRSWLENDLKTANANRDNVPWIIAHGHRDIYCSTSDDNDCASPGDAGKIRDDLEPLFYKYGLDIWINGHEHSYERTYPLYKGASVKSYIDPAATIYIVTGAAGSPEMHEAFDNNPPSWSAFRSNTFGYSRALVHNATHLRWQQVQTDPTLFPTSDYGRVIDDVWFIQHKHGPFDAARAPNGTAFPSGTDSRARTDDHWGPLLPFLDHASGRAVSELIREFVAEHGERAWAEKEDDLLKIANNFTGGTGEVWEDVRAEGLSSSGAWFKWK